MTLRKLKYRPTVHAIERMREYFGTKEIHAVDYANELMKGAQFVTTQPESGRKVYKSIVQDVMIVVGATDNAIITILPSQEMRKEVESPKPVSVQVLQSGALTDVIRATIERELRKARRTFKRSYRQYTLELAKLNVKIAESKLNKVRCKHPGTQAIIQAQIDALEAEAKSLQDAMSTQESEYRAIEAEASVYLRTEGELVSQ